MWSHFLRSTKQVYLSSRYNSYCSWTVLSGCKTLRFDNSTLIHFCLVRFLTGQINVCNRTSFKLIQFRFECHCVQPQTHHCNTLLRANQTFYVGPAFLKVWPGLNRKSRLSCPSFSSFISKGIVWAFKDTCMSYELTKSNGMSKYLCDTKH